MTTRTKSAGAATLAAPSLDSIRSGSPVTDFERALARISEGLAKAGAPARDAGAPEQTLLKISEDGKTLLVRKVGLPLLTGATPPKPTDAELRALVEARGMPWKDGYFGRAIPWWASDERVDAHGDIVRQDWNFTEFAVNSPLLKQHEWGGDPIGRVIDWKTVANRVDGAYSGPALWVLPLFALAEDAPVAESQFRLAKAGILRTGSVGFRAGRVVDVADPEERTALGLGPWGFVLEQNTLLEFSIVAMPANKGALALLSAAKQRGELESEDLDVARDLFRANVRSREEWKMVDDRMVAMAKTLFPRATFARNADPAVPIVDRSLEVPASALKSVSIEERIERIETLLEEGLLSLGTRLDDVRTLLEINMADASARSAEAHSSHSSTPGGKANAGESVVSLRDRYRTISDRIAAISASAANKSV